MTVGIAASQLNAMLDALCRSVAYSDPAGFYLKLHLGDPGSAGTSNAATETTRQAATFSAASGGAITNSVAVTWTNVSTTETYTHVSFWSAVTVGTFLGSAVIPTPFAATAGDSFTLPIGDIDLAFSPVAA